MLLIQLALEVRGLAARNNWNSKWCFCDLTHSPFRIRGFSCGSCWGAGCGWLQLEAGWLSLSSVTAPDSWHIYWGQLLCLTLTCLLPFTACWLAWCFLSAQVTSFQEVARGQTCHFFCFSVHYKEGQHGFCAFVTGFIIVTIIMSCNLTWGLFCSHTPLVCVPLSCTKTPCRGIVELPVLFRKPASDTVLLLVCIPTTSGNITVLGLDMSFQNLVEGGKWALWKASPSLEVLESGYSLVYFESGWQQVAWPSFMVVCAILQTKNFSVYSMTWMKCSEVEYQSLV